MAVSVLRTVTAAPGTTPPLESFTTPRIVPVGICAKLTDASATRINPSDNTYSFLAITFLLIFCSRTRIPRLTDPVFLNPNLSSHESSYSHGSNSPLVRFPATLLQHYSLAAKYNTKVQMLPVIASAIRLR